MPRTKSSSPSTAIAESTTARPRESKTSAAMGLAIADVGILLLVLGLTFVLGIFPQHDTDFWWHLRTGDLILKTGQLPRTDWYTFGAASHAWIDLHWGFQVALSALYAAGGVNATIAAKCIVTTLALGLLITAKRREWPLWVMALAWVPALLVLGGRMYVRPETLTLLYLSIDLAVLTRVDRHPRLAWVLPVTQVFWVNTQGLFVLGPAVIGMALIDAALRRGSFGKDRRTWWRTVLAATLATGLACFVNPYGLFGALFPLQLLGTMSSPVFSEILELQSIPDFIAKNGFENLPLQLHFLVMAIGALSFLIPLLSVLRDRANRFEAEELATNARKRRAVSKAARRPSWRFSLFRLMLYVVFSAFSLKATRNSHQFAAVVGAVTAWNFGEWGAALAARRPRTDPSAAPLIPRLASALVVAAMILLVATGGFYALTKEGRTVGWGEAPLWFAHDAVKFAGSPGMPSRFLTYHNGVAGLFEYHNGPKQKVFADARLEVMGTDVYSQDKALSKEIAGQREGWVRRIERLGPPTPGLVIDHVQPPTTDLIVTMLGSSEWRCVYYDTLASVYLPVGGYAQFPTVDFAARHFGRDLSPEPVGAEALAMSARNAALQSRGLFARSTNATTSHALGVLGSGYGRKSLTLDATAPKTWRSLGVIAVLGIPGSADEDPRFRLPLDPIVDLPYCRATHDFEQASRLGPDDFETQAYLFNLYFGRGMYGAANAAGQRLQQFGSTRERLMVLRELMPKLGLAQASASKPAKTQWANASELDQVIAGLYKDGRAEKAADLLETAYPVRERTWEQTDRIATIRLHLGRPDMARATWAEAIQVPRSALLQSPLALCMLIQGDFDGARTTYRAAIAEEPGLFDAHYGLAVLERDAGNAAACLTAAEAAMKAAGSKSARAAAESIADFARPFAKVSASTLAKP